MAARTKISRNNGLEKNLGASRYWISVDFGILGNYQRLYEWLDSLGAEECGTGLATVKSDRTRDELASELRAILKDTPRARAYIISMKQGGKFVVGSRKAAQWQGFAKPIPSEEDES